MPTRVRRCEKGPGEPFATLSLLAAHGDTITQVIEAPDAWVILLDQRPAFEVRVEKPDTTGGAARPIDPDVIEHAVERHWGER